PGPALHHRRRPLPPPAPGGLRPQPPPGGRLLPLRPRRRPVPPRRHLATPLRRRPDRSRRRRPRRPRSRGPGMTAQRPAAPNAQQPGLAADVPQTPRSEVSKGERAIPLFHRCDNAITHPDWRPLEYAIHAWTRAHGGSELLARVAAETSLAESLGHTALYPAEALGLDAEALQSLRAQPRHVGTGEGGP